MNKTLIEELNEIMPTVEIKRQDSMTATFKFTTPMGYRCYETKDSFRKKTTTSDVLRFASDLRKESRDYLYNKRLEGIKQDY